MNRRRTLLHASLILFTAQLLVMGVVYALVPDLGITYHFDFDSARGFWNVVGSTYRPTFVLMTGTEGTVNVTVRPWHDEIVTLSVTGGGKGITYSIEPISNMTLPAGSNATVTLRIKAAPDTELGRYNLILNVGYIEVDRFGGGRELPPNTYTPPFTLTIIEGNTSTTRTVNTTTYITETVTTTQTITPTSTVSSTTTSSSTTHSNQTTRTSAMTSTGQANEPPLYAWAMSATVAVAVLVAILLLQRRTK